MKSPRNGARGANEKEEEGDIFEPFLLRGSFSAAERRRCVGGGCMTHARCEWEVSVCGKEDASSGRFSVNVLS